jgi:hypothetical protein
MDWLVTAASSSGLAASVVACFLLAAMSAASSWVVALDPWWEAAVTQALPRSVMSAVVSELSVAAIPAASAIAVAALVVLVVAAARRAPVAAAVVSEKSVSEGFGAVADEVETVAVVVAETSVHPKSRRSLSRLQWCPGHQLPGHFRHQ